jgi:alkanesulfonate monooxygenase SsuD/methylene tetrahydromethanopterin reductase-like flavin-dependent oxidoreductase (luciferase family)
MARVGLQLPSFTWSGGPAAIASHLREIAVAAEDAGFASLWVMDHLFQLPEETGLGGPEQPMLEAYTTLGFLAAATNRIRIGALVGNAVTRPPGLLLKIATTLDVLAGGRSYFGVGAGWYAREAHGLGIAWPARGERFEVLEDTVRLARQVWDGSRAAFAGRRTALPEPIVVPQPLAAPRPSIMIGGGGDRTLRLVARYADACNILVPDPGESRRRIEFLRESCASIGRDPAEIETTSLIEVDLRPGRMSAEAVRRAILDQVDEGIQHVIVNLPEVDDLRHLATFREEIIPAVRDAMPVAA